MTNDEAIRMLQRIQEPEPYEPQITQAAYEALEMAISALEESEDHTEVIKDMYGNIIKRINKSAQNVPNDDLISRKAAIDALNEEIIQEENILFGDEYANGYNSGLVEAISIINNMPSAQPERNKGKWNTYYHGNTDFSYSCNQCGYSAPYQTIGGEVHQKKWNFCPNCGADMRGEANEQIN